MQRNEKAQETVHDLDLFVTVQTFDDTPAGLSLGKLCEEHGYSYELVSGQEPRSTKQGKKQYAKRIMSFLLLSQDCRQVPQARAKRLLHRFRRTHQVLRAQYVSDQEAAGNRLRDLPEWLEEFTENLEDTSHDSDLERPPKAASRKHSIFT